MESLMKLGIALSFSLVLAGCLAMQGSISQDDVYTSRERLFTLKLPRPYTHDSQKYFIKDYHESDGRIGVQFDVSFSFRRGDAVVGVVFIPQKTAEQRYAAAEKLKFNLCGNNNSRRLEWQVLSANTWVLSERSRQLPVVVGSETKMIGGRDVAYCVLMIQSSFPPGRSYVGVSESGVRTESKPQQEALYVGQYAWQVEGGVLLMTFVAQPIGSLLAPPTTGQLRSASQVASDEAVVASLKFNGPGR